MSPLRNRTGAPLTVTVVGGGSGISAVLRGFGRLRALGHPVEVTAVVATADDGGSTGRLRRDRGGLPLGDLRSALVALAPEESPLSSLFAHRFDGTGEVGGHALGNLMLLALAERTGSTIEALAEAGRILKSAGRVFPATKEPVVLRAETRGGSRLDGESVVGACADGIERVWLEPGAPEPPPEAEKAIRDAELVVIGPGSLFTSLLPVLLVPALGAALREARGRRVLVANLMTQKGETVGMDLDGHLGALEAHLGPGLVDDVLVHRGGIEPSRLTPYAAEGAVRVRPVLRTPRRERVLAGDLLCRSGKIRHDPDRTSATLLRLALGREERAAGQRRARPLGVR